MSKTKKAPINKEQRAKLRKLVQQEGQAALAERLGIGPATIARALGGLDLRRGNVVIIEQALAAAPAAEGQVSS